MSKTCSVCKREKAISEFHRRGTFVTLSGKRTPQYSSLCKPCRANYRRIPESHYSRKSKYGLTREGYEALLISQDNKCAACGNEFTGDAHIDHNHETNEVRGILCRSCNIALGLAKDSAIVLRAIADYRERYK